MPVRDPPLSCAERTSAEPTDFVLPACQREFVSLSGLSPAKPTDLVQWWSQFHWYDYDNSLRASSGVACATACDPRQCESALARSDLQRPGFRYYCEGRPCYGEYLVVTQGDDVRVLSKPQEVRDWLLPIDTPAEAALLAYAHGYDLSCTDLERGAVKTQADGTFQLVTTRRDRTCRTDGPVLRVHLEVSPCGTVNELGAEVLEPHDKDCEEP